jgi:hypothetical protein
MNELTSLGLILLFALLVGHLIKFIRVPEVTGYLIAGIVVGPSVLGVITHENLQAFHPRSCTRARNRSPHQLHPPAQVERHRPRPRHHPMACGDRQDRLRARASSV